MSDDPRLRQTAGNAVGGGQSRTCRATFTAATSTGNLVVVSAVAGSGTATLTGPSGFTLVPGSDRAQGGIRTGVWFRGDCPSISSVTVAINQDRSLQVRVMEYEGAAQADVLDRITVRTSSTDTPQTGSSGTIAQPDEIVVSVVANQFASTTQSGFSGGLSRIIEGVSPASWGFLGLSRDSDDARTRLTIHNTVTVSVSSFFLSALLSSIRNWIAILITFRGRSSGPALASSALDNTVFALDGFGEATVFGPFQTGVLAESNADVFAMDGVRARVGPFDYQYRLGGWGGLLIGAGTDYPVASIDGLEGWQVRTSDDDLPRGDGAIRGVDLQSARQFLVELTMAGDRRTVEVLLDVLWRALVHQRDADFEFLWRHPGKPLRIVRCRPIELSRDLDPVKTVVHPQAFALRAADPRLYSAIEHTVTVPNTAAGADPVTTSVVNLGNGPAYPEVLVDGPAGWVEPVTRIELVNEANDVTFDVRAALPGGSVLVGDMEARATGAGRSVVTIDGQSKYGGWQFPRQTWQLNPGANAVFLRTEPAGAPVVCRLRFRDSWGG